MRFSSSIATNRCSISIAVRDSPRDDACAHRPRGVLGGRVGRQPVERGGEEERLTLARAAANDPVDRGTEAHVEHPVGLVEDEDADAVERQCPARELILEPPGRRHDDV